MKKDLSGEEGNHGMSMKRPKRPRRLNRAGKLRPGHPRGESLSSVLIAGALAFSLVRVVCALTRED